MKQRTKVKLQEKISKYDKETSQYFGVPEDYIKQQQQADPWIFRHEEEDEVIVNSLEIMPNSRWNWYGEKGDHTLYHEELSRLEGDNKPLMTYDEWWQKNRMKVLEQEEKARRKLYENEMKGDNNGGK